MELNKNILTDEQKLVKEVIDKINKELNIEWNSYGKIYKEDFDRIIKKINKEYKLIPKYDILRDYLKEHAMGAYHKFIFYIDGKEMNCIGAYDFEQYYNSRLLDMYVVVKDEQKNKGENCENYECVHKLTIEKKEEEQAEDK